MFIAPCCISQVCSSCNNAFKEGTKASVTDGRFVCEPCVQDLKEDAEVTEHKTLPLQVHDFRTLALLTKEIERTSRNFDLDIEVESGPTPTAYQRKMTMDLVMALLKKKKRLNLEEAYGIITRATKELEKEPNLLEIDSKDLFVVGDLHGQLEDLLLNLKIMETLGKGGRMLFLGDYVDRGDNSCEVLLIVCLLKTLYPERVFLLRGNHESRSISKLYGFHKEAAKKYSTKFYELCILLFKALPIAAKVEGTDAYFLAVHGGLSEHLNLISDFNTVIPNRVENRMEPEDHPLMYQSLWNDPFPDYKGYLADTLRLGVDPLTEEEYNAKYFVQNAMRGSEIDYFSKAATEALIEREREARAKDPTLAPKPLVGIIRAHLPPEVNGIGGVILQDGLVINPFGASFYTGLNNRGSILQLSASALHGNRIADFSIVKPTPTRLAFFDPLSELFQRFPKLPAALARFGPLLHGCDAHGPLLPAPVFTSPVSL